MIKLTPNQLDDLLNIIKQQTLLFVGSTLGPEYLSEADKAILGDFGVNAEEIYQLHNDPIFLNYQLGMLSQVLKDDVVKALPYGELKKMVVRGEYIKLNKQEQAVINDVRNRTLLDIRAKGDHIFQDINNIIQESSSLSVREAQEKVIRDEIEQGLIKRKQIAEITRSLHDKTGDWSRDFGRIVQYVSHKALTEGRAAVIKRAEGESDNEVYVHVYSGACKHCVDLYLTNGQGSAPKVMTLGELETNGTNIGRKVADWKAVMPPAHPYCYDQETEVLTDDGWKYFKDLDRTEKFLSVNIETGEGEWNNAVGWIDEKYSGPMVEWKNKNNDLLTTPNHNHVFTTYSTKNNRLRIESKLPSEAKLLKHLPKWRGKMIEDFRFDNRIFNSSDFVEFMGYYISEGSLIFHKNWRIHLSQKKDHIKKNIYDNARRLFPSVSNNDGYIQISLKKDQKELIDYLSLGKSHQKYIPKNIKQLDSSLIKLFLKAFNKGDGSIRKNNKDWDGYKSKDQRLYYTSSRKLADDLGELILKTQNTPSYKFKEPQSIYDPKRDQEYMQNNGIWIITETTNKYAFRPALNEKIILYSGRIYDVELERNHTLFVRRGGRVLVSGNCRCQLMQYSGGEWDGKKFIQTEGYQSKIDRKKIKIIVGNKEYLV